MTSLPLFDAEGLQVPEEIRLTLGDGPLVRPARVGFLAGMLATWLLGGKPTEAQKDALLDLSREFLQRVTETIKPGGTP